MGDNDNDIREVLLVNRLGWDRPKESGSALRHFGKIVEFDQNDQFYACLGYGQINECIIKGNFEMINEYSICPGKQVINNAQEIIIPKVQAWWQNQNVSL